MNTLKALLIGSASAALFGLSQGAVAAWTSPADCSGAGSAPCIIFDDGSTTHSFNGGSSNTWHGNPNGGDFNFSGDTVLSCSGLPDLDCTLSLDGQVQKFYDGTDWRVGIKVTDGSVSGGGLCGLVSTGGYPWYAGDVNTHNGFGNTTGIVFPGTLIGNIGGSAASGGIVVTALGVTVAEDSHIHDVTYDNVGTFSFTENLYENGSDVDTGCSVVGDLDLQNGTSLSIN